MNNVNEIWEQVSGYEGIYEISNLGRVKALERIQYNFHWIEGKAVRHKERILIITKCKRTGYQMIYLSKNKKSKYHSLHRLVAIHFLPNPNNLPQVNHKDGNKLNNVFDNLEWCTRSYNIKHAFANSLIVAIRGEKNSRAKLTDTQASKIKEIYRTSKITQVKLGQMFGVSGGYIHKIVSGSRWKHIV